MASRHRDAYVALMDRLFSTYAAQIDPMIAHIERVLPIESVAARHPTTGEPLDFADVKSVMQGAGSALMPPPPCRLSA